MAPLNGVKCNQVEKDYVAISIKSGYKYSGLVILVT